MPKPQTASQALHAYSRQQRVGRLSSSRLRTAHRPEPPLSAWICGLVELATEWLARNDPEVAADRLNREAMALVGDFLSLTPRGPIPQQGYRERFRDYLDGAPPLLGDPQN